MVTMTSGIFCFEGFLLDPQDRQLRWNDAPVELNSRYLDALTLMVQEPGKLIPKDRFLDEVWRGIPVTDEALTQCVKTLRRQLGDNASNPRFIETVPKHGYRFIAPVEWIDADRGEPPALPPPPQNDPGAWTRMPMLGVAGTVGGGLAGLVGGIFYGLAGASQPLEPGMGAISILLILICLTVLVGVMGGAGVGFGLAAADRTGSGPPWRSVGGGAAGGMVVGAVVKLLGLDAFTLLLGQSPGDITGPLEGLILGGAVGLGAWLGRAASIRKAATYSAAMGAIAGMAIPAMGLHLMGGSLALLASRFPGSHLRLDHIGQTFGEPGFGPVSQIVTGALEGMLFSACVVAAIRIARRHLGS